MPSSSTAADHPLADLPVTLRIDATLATLSAGGHTPDGGWSVAELAELCGCTEGAIYHRLHAALGSARRTAESLGVTPRDLLRITNEAPQDHD